MATDTVENYLKAILAVCEESPSAEATVSRVAALVGVTPGTATTMIKKLGAAKLARYEKYGAVTLTPKGTKAALDVVRRHRVIEQFLVQIVGLDWSDVHDEAERLEHAVSARLLDRLDEMLGRPTVDPHGDPIPDGTGRMRGRMHGPRLAPLSTCAAGARVQVGRVLDQEAGFLRFLEASGLKPGRALLIEQVDANADALQLRPAGGKRVTISRGAAAKILVEASHR